MAFASRVRDALESTYPQAAMLLEQELREQATAAGWPKSAAQTIKVNVVDGGFKASAGKGSDEYEYGTEERPPLSVLRVFNLKQHNTADAVVGRLLDQAMGAL